MIWSVTVTKFGTVRGVGVGAGACATPVNPAAHSRAVVRNHSLIGHLITPSLGRVRRQPGRCGPPEEHLKNRSRGTTQAYKAWTAAIGSITASPARAAQGRPVQSVLKTIVRGRL